ncbi:MAG: Xaa-Pro dipeptidase [Planctomycetota bacterium]|jgi:Xaa-Pro dipeptidase
MNAQIFRRRRDELRQAVGSGILFFPGNPLIPRNYPDNVYPYRQNSQLLYLTGISTPGIALVMGEGSAEDSLFGPPADLDDLIWHGPHPSLEELAAGAGMSDVHNIAELGPYLCTRRADGAQVRFLPPYHERVLTWMSRILGDSTEELRVGACAKLAEAVVAQRLIKSREEIDEIENALEITRLMHLEAMRIACPGIKESAIVGAIQQIAIENGRAQAYNPIVSVRGEVLHNNTYKNTLEEGDLLLNDSGAESTGFYASDITRTFPVTGKFDSRQQAIYEVCLQSQLEAIDMIKPGASYRDIHIHACSVITAGLAELGLMTEKARFNVGDAVDAGAHALFFPHGLGHAIGLDVHDMEDLGDAVGYGDSMGRSDQFGLNFLRFAKPLEAGHVMTVEPGIYFIPALIDRWEKEGINSDFINFDVVRGFVDLGGIRIEDDVLCTEEGNRVLGEPIPKTIADIENACA